MAAPLVVVLLKPVSFFIVNPVLGLIGFGGIGPVAGSIAAWLQSMYGVGWLFSALQSAAMGGYAFTAVNGVAQTVIGVGGVVIAWIWGR